MLIVAIFFAVLTAIALYMYANAKSELKYAKRKAEQETATWEAVMFEFMLENEMGREPGETAKEKQCEVLKKVLKRNLLEHLETLIKTHDWLGRGSKPATDALVDGTQYRFFVSSQKLQKFRDRMLGLLSDRNFDGARALIETSVNALCGYQPPQ